MKLLHSPVLASFFFSFCLCLQKDALFSNPKWCFVYLQNYYGIIGFEAYVLWGTDVNKVLLLTVMGSPILNL